MSISEEQVRHVARLARLGLSDDQITTLGVELNGILEHVELISALDLDDVEPTAHAVSVTDSVRPDEVRPCLPQERALLNAPDREAGAFRIPKFGG